MKSIRPVFATALVLCLVPVLAAAQAKESEKIHKVVPIGAGGTLELKNFSGDVRIAGADVAEVTIDAVRRATRDRLDHIKLDIRTSGSSVIVEANKKDEAWTSQKDNVVETEFDIQVPRAAKLKIDVFSSAVQVRNVSGEQSIHTFSGATTVENAAARVAAKTFSGGVTVRLAAGAAGPDLDLETFSGHIDVRLTEGARAGVSFDSFSGTLKSDWPMTLHEQRRGHLRADLNGGDAQHALRLKTFSGDATIGK